MPTACFVRQQAYQMMPMPDPYLRQPDGAQSLHLYLCPILLRRPIRIRSYQGLAHTYRAPIKHPKICGRSKYHCSHRQRSNRFRSLLSYQNIKVRAAAPSSAVRNAIENAAAIVSTVITAAAIFKIRAIFFSFLSSSSVLAF